MKRLALIAVAITIAAPAMAQGTFTFQPYGASIYGGAPQGYVGQYQNNGGEVSDIARQQLQRFQSRTTTCTTYGNQTVCQ